MPSSLQTMIDQNIKAVRKDISAMQKHAGLPGKQPKLIAVSKVQPQERIIAALEAGQRVFGENRVQEASERWQKLKTQYDGLELHLIGSLQTNKVAKAIALFDVIQTVDRIKLAKALAAEMIKQGRHLPVFLQVNTGQEDQKSGCIPHDLAALVAVAQEAKLNLVGLMCIPPVGEEPALHFALLNKLARRHNLERLSMGMSSDFALASTMGATDIRVGTAIFGERDSSPAS